MDPANFEDAGANLGPAINGGVFEDFSLGAPVMPDPSTVARKTVKEIKNLLDRLVPPVDYSQAKRKQDYIDLYTQNYPPSPAFSPQSAPSSSS